MGEAVDGLHKGQHAARRGLVELDARRTEPAGVRRRTPRAAGMECKYREEAHMLNAPQVEVTLP